jgi:hypothetical protein
MFNAVARNHAIDGTQPALQSAAGRYSYGPII